MSTSLITRMTIHTIIKRKKSLTLMIKRASPAGKISKAKDQLDI